MFPGPQISPAYMFPGPHIPRAECSPVSVFRNQHVPRSPYSQTDLFPGPHIPRSCMFQVLIFLQATHSQIRIFLGTTCSQVPIFPNLDVPKGSDSQTDMFPRSNIPRVIHSYQHHLRSPHFQIDMFPGPHLLISTWSRDHTLKVPMDVLRGLFSRAQIND